MGMEEAEWEHEKVQAKALRKPISRLKEVAKKGTAELQMESTEGFVLQDTIEIGVEVRTIIGVAPIILDFPLDYTHPVNTTVKYLFSHARPHRHVVKKYTHHLHCFVNNSEWIPVLTHEPIGKALNALECQAVCSEVAECHHFTFWPDEDCSLHGEHARLIAGAAATGAITGPADCTRSFSDSSVGYAGGLASSPRIWMVWAVLAVVFGIAMVVIFCIVIYNMFFNSDRRSARKRGRHRRIVDMEEHMPMSSGAQTEEDLTPQYVVGHRPAVAQSFTPIPSQASQHYNARSVQMPGAATHRPWSS